MTDTTSATPVDGTAVDTTPVVQDSSGVAATPAPVPTRRPAPVAPKPGPPPGRRSSPIRAASTTPPPSPSPSPST